MRNVGFLVVATAILSWTNFASAQPATQPAARPFASLAKTVLFLPMATASDPTTYGWIAQSIQQHLPAQFDRSTFVLPVAPADAKPATSADQALEAGRQANAWAVVFGDYVAASGVVRISGQVLNVQTGQSLGTLSAAGQSRDLLALQDILAEQLRKALLPGDIYVPRQIATPQIEPSGPVQARNPPQQPPQPAYRYAPPVYPPPYYWPYYYDWDDWWDLSGIVVWPGPIVRGEQFGFDDVRPIRGGPPSLVGRPPSLTGRPPGNTGRPPPLSPPIPSGGGRSGGRVPMRP